jgi:hypothetical protein
VTNSTTVYPRGVVGASLGYAVLEPCITPSRSTLGYIKESQHFLGAKERSTSSHFLASLRCRPSLGLLDPLNIEDFMLLVNAEMVKAFWNVLKYVR